MKLILHNIAYGTGVSDWWEYFLPWKQRSTHRIRGMLSRYMDEDADLIALLEVPLDRIPRSPYTVHAKCKYAFDVPYIRDNGNALLVKGSAEVLHKYLSAGVKQLFFRAMYKGITFFVVHLSLRPWIRKKQFEQLADELKTVSGPVVVMGDFNTDAVHDFKTLSGLDHHGALATFPSRSPKKSWDHILTKGVSVVSYDTLPVQGSDHVAVMMEIE